MDQRTQGGPTTPPPLPANTLPVESEKEGGGGKKDDEDEKRKREKERDAVPAVPCISESGAGDQQQQQSPQFSVKETSYSEGNVKLKIGLQAKRMKKPPKILENYVCRPAFRATVRHGSRGGGRGSRRVGPSDGSGNNPSVPHIKEAEKDPTVNPGAPQSSGVPSNTAPTSSLPPSASTSPETPVNGNTPAKRKEKETLKMQLMSEMKLVAVVKGNIASVMKEYKETEADCEREKDKVVKEHEEASSAFAQLETEMVKLREVHTAKSKKIEDLKRKLSDVLTAHKTLSDDLDQQKRACLDHLHSAKEAHKTVLVRCEQVSRRIEELRLKCEEYRKESAVMEDMVTAMPQILEELQSECDMVEYKHNLISTVMSSLQSDTVACRNRTALSKEAHSSLLSQQQALMQDLKANLRKALKENVELAQEYRELQKAVMVAKREAVFTLSEKNRAEASFHNHTQLSLLQRRMHKAMLKYFKHRSVYSQAELAGFQALSNQNKQKMKALQEDLSRAIQRISAFLTDASHDTTADKQRRVDLDGLNRPMPTVQIAE